VVLTDGRRLECRAFGDPAGVPVVYCHGGLSAPGDIAFADGAARARGIRLVAPARPGIGDSDRAPSPGRQVADWAADVGAVADTLGLENFAVLGWSAGGPFALACAARLGARVTRAVTVGGMAPLVAPVSASQLGLRLDKVLFPMSVRHRSLAALVVRASALVPARAVRSSLVRALPPEDRVAVAAMSPAEAASGLREATRHGPAGVVDDYATLAGDWGFALSEITVPVTVLQGAADTLLPRAHAEALAAALASGRLEVVDGAGHFLLHTHLGTAFDALVG
jgi:pimeloyl-ACP methyl ester carboxylesterase